MNIILRDITKSFGKKTVIPKLSLTLEDGKFTTLLGPSGCGKTTLLRMIAGLETPETGEILFDDELVFSKEKRVNLPPEKRNLSFVFQDFALWPHMTVFENVAFGLRARKRTQNLTEKVENALRTVSLAGFEKRYPHELSGGQQQRVAFARAIVVEPRCILFDEPLSALDAKLREEMRVEIKALTEKLHTTSVFVTHDQGEAMSMSDKIAVMNGGNVEQYDTPVNIYEQPKTKFVGSFVGSSNWLDEQTMIRPNAMFLAANEDAQDENTVDCTVLSTQYQGGLYTVFLQSEHGRWTFHSQDRLPVGTETKLAFRTEDVIRFPL